jgi:hypothetical protein
MIRRWRIVIAIGSALLLLALYVGLNYAVLHGPVDGDSLRQSVGRATDTLATDEPCEPLAEARTWHCEVWDTGQSGTVPYRVRVAPDSSCWRGRRIGSHPVEGPMPDRPSACVYRWD